MLAFRLVVCPVDDNTPLLSGESFDDATDDENAVPLSAARPFEDDSSVSECIELAELEKCEAAELRLRRIAFTSSKSSPTREKRSTRLLTAPCPNSAVGLDSSTCL